MRLNDYIHRTGIPIARLADRCGLTFHQVYHIMNGREPKLRTAIRISRYTEVNPLTIEEKQHWVKPEEMVPLDVIDEIHKELSKN